MSLKPELSSWKKSLQEAEQELGQLVKGLVNYRNAKVQVENYNGSVILDEEHVRVYKYGKSGVPMLFIPSHINKPYILDLEPDNSFLLKLSNMGIAPYLIEWKESSVKSKFTMGDYLERSIYSALKCLAQIEKRQICVAGYCMGGLFALAALSRYPDIISGVVTIATPWNFHSMDFLRFRSMISFASYYKNILADWDWIPKELLQLFFYFLNQESVIKKYKIFGGNAKKLESQLLVENWVNDGIDVSTPLFIECLEKFVCENQTHEGKWQIDGIPVLPVKVNKPAFCAIALKDKITPKGSTLPIISALKYPYVKLIDTGHIGLINCSKSGIASDLAKWANNL